jgi:hypothetical protein
VLSLQVQEGLDLVEAKVGPLLKERDVKYEVHILKHSTNAAGVAEAIASKAKILHAHSITMTHHKHNALQV